MISEYEAIKKILDSNHITDIDDIEYGGECFDELMDYFADEMPYGVKKARTEADYEKWLFNNIHAVVYITLSSTMLFVTMVYVIQWSLDKLGLKRKMAELEDPRRPDEEKNKIKKTSGGV